MLECPGRCQDGACVNVLNNICSGASTRENIDLHITTPHINAQYAIGATIPLHYQARDRNRGCELSPNDMIWYAWGSALDNGRELILGYGNDRALNTARLHAGNVTIAAYYLGAADHRAVSVQVTVYLS